MADRRFQPKKRPSRIRNHVVLLVLLAVLLAGSVFMFVPPDQKVTQGLDVQGGLSVVLQANKADGTTPTLEEMQSSQQIVERRVNALGATEASVQTQSSNQLLVQIPGLVDQTQALDTIGQTGVLEFVDLSTVDDDTLTQAINSGLLLSDQDINEMLAFGSISASQVATQLVNGRAPAGMYQQLSIPTSGTDTGLASDTSAEPDSSQTTGASDSSSADSASTQDTNEAPPAVPADNGEAAATEQPGDAGDEAGEGSAVDQYAADEAATDDTATDEAATDDAAADDTATDDTATDEAATDDTATDEATTDDAADDAATAGNNENSSTDTGSTITYYAPLKLTAGTYTPVFTGGDITSVSIGRESDISAYYAVNIKLNAQATTAWGETTTRLYPTRGKVAIVLDGVIQSTPAVQSAITNGSTAITGNYTQSDAASLKTVLESGSLPVSLQVINSQVVGPTLGQESLFRGVMVALIGLAIVALYLLFFYRGIGLLTAGAVGVFALLYLGILATLSFFGQFALSLAGIAGIVLAIGVAADSSILVLERFKEEIRMGRSVRASSITGVRHAIITSIDADLVTLISALALFFIGVGSVRGFGLTLALGVICDIVTMLLFKAPLIRLLAPGIITKHPGFWGVKEDEELALAAGELNRGVANG